MRISENIRGVRFKELKSFLREEWSTAPEVVDELLLGIIAEAEFQFRDDAKTEYAVVKIELSQALHHKRISLIIPRER